MRNPEQFEAFLRSYQDMVYGTAMRLLANSAESEDIAQEVFIKAHEHFDDLRDSPAAGGWLRTVTTNLCLNHISRYRSRWSFFSELFQSREGEETEPDFAADTNVEAEIASSENYAVVERAIQKLPQAQRVALVLFHLEGMQYEEIARKLGVSIGKIKTDIFRGREALRKVLNREELKP